MAKAALQKEIEQAPKSNLTIDELYNLSYKDRDICMDKYFDMRMNDYLIHLYTRYGSSEAAKQDIIEEFNERNVQFAKKVK